MQRTNLAYQHNAELATLEAAVTTTKTITSLDGPDKDLFKHANNDSVIVTIESTVFHPQGGGQPSDSGHMRSVSGALFIVLMVRMSISTPGVVLHLGRFEDASLVFKSGETIVQTVDMEQRTLKSRYHTAGHVLGAAVRCVVGNQIEDFDELKASHFPDSAACEFQGLIESKWKDQIQQKVDEYVSEDMPVEIDWWSENDFKINGLERLIPDRMAMGMTDEELFRVVKIIGADVYPCGGTHVKSTLLCGQTTVKKISRSKGTSRVGYRLT